MRVTGTLLQDADMAAITRRSPFLSLPTELRLKVYEELLSPHPSIPTLLYCGGTGRGISKNLYPSVLGVSQQVYSEAVSILYDHNIFRVDLSNPHGIY